MVREFSEEKRQEIFRLLDEIDQKEWKSFMEWCGSRAEEFGDWPDKLSVSAYTRYVDEYHEKVLEINEMTRQQVNTVFENVAEIDARYAARMRECQKKIRDQIAIVRTMTEFMDSMADGKPNMALITKGSVDESIRTEEEVDLPVTSSDDAENETSIYFLNDYFDSGEEFSEGEIGRILEGAVTSGDITQNEYNSLVYLFTIMFNTTNEINGKIIFEIIKIMYDLIMIRNQNTQINNTNIYFLNDYFYSGEEFDEAEIRRILKGGLLSRNITWNEYNNLKNLFADLYVLKNATDPDENAIQSKYEEIKAEYERITERNQNLKMYINETGIFSLSDYFDSGEEFSEDEILRILEGALLSAVITQNEYDRMKKLLTEMNDMEELEKVYNRIIRRIRFNKNEVAIYFLNDYFYSGEELSENEIIRILNGALRSGDITHNEYENLKKLFTDMFCETNETRRNYIYKTIKKHMIG